MTLNMFEHDPVTLQLIYHLSFYTSTNRLDIIFFVPFMYTFMEISDYDHNCAHNYVKSYFLVQLWFFINVYIYVCMCVNVCMYICMHVWMYVCEYVCM